MDLYISNEASCVTDVNISINICRFSINFPHCWQLWSGSVKPELYRVMKDIVRVQSEQFAHHLLAAHVLKVMKHWSLVTIMIRVFYVWVCNWYEKCRKNDNGSQCDMNIAGCDKSDFTQLCGRRVFCHKALGSDGFNRVWTCKRGYQRPAC
jgi:hypothetical protein